MHDLCTDCFGNRLRVGDTVMFTINGKTTSEFRQGLVEKIGLKLLTVVELDHTGSVKYKEETDKPVKHRRSVLGLMRVFTEEDHQLMQEEEDEIRVH